MYYSEIVKLLNESQLSPEAIAEWIAVSNSTYRNWMKAPAKGLMPESYRAGISEGIYKMLSKGLLSHESKQVNDYIQSNIPEFFNAAVAGLCATPEMLHGDASHQDKITAILSHLGNSDVRRRKVS